MFCCIKSAKLLSNNTNIWIQWDITQCLAQTQSFYFSGIVSTNYITRNLAGISVIILSHAGQQHPGFYLNLIHMPRQSGSICDNLLHLRVLLGDGQSPRQRLRTPAAVVSRVISAHGVCPSTGKSTELRYISSPVGLYSHSHHFSWIIKYAEGW